MTAEQIMDLFQKINAELEKISLNGTILICGGALMALNYNRERVTEDIDALFRPKEEFEQIISDLADKHGLPKNWLNDEITKTLSLSDYESEVIAHFSHLEVRAVTIEVLLAMKLMACRDKDANDIKLLVSRLGNFDFDEVMELVRKYAPSNRLMYANYFLKAIFNGIGKKDLSKLHYSQFHKSGELVDALSEFAADHTFPQCHPLDDVLKMACKGPLMENAKAYVQYLVDEGHS